MKIAMLGHKRIPGREGGIEVVVEELATRLVNMGHNVTVYNRSSTKSSRIKDYMGVKIITIPTINLKSLDAVIYSFLASMHCLFGHYDVIHFHALGPSVMLIIPHLFGIRTVVTVHGLNWKTPKWAGLGAAYIKLGEVITAKYADEIIVLSLEQQNYFKGRYNRNVIYIPNGVTLPKIRDCNIILKEWALHKNDYILFLSRIVPGKGLEHLIQAYEKVKTDMKLVISGEGEYVSDFVKSIKGMAKDDNRIIFTGFVEGEVLDELYSNAFLFVFPSEAEGMPMCLLEALSYNCKCLVSDIPENIEVIKNYGNTFQVFNVDSLRVALNKIINEKKEELSLNTREYVAVNYNWDTIVTNTLQVYEKVVLIKE